MTSSTPRRWLRLGTGRPQQVIAVAEVSVDNAPFAIAATGAHVSVVLPYLDVEISCLQARLLRMPSRAEIPITVDEHLVVEFYAR